MLVLSILVRRPRESGIFPPAKRREVKYVWYTVQYGTPLLIVNTTRACINEFFFLLIKLSLFVVAAVVSTELRRTSDWTI